MSRAQTIIQVDSTDLIFLDAMKNCAYLFNPQKRKIKGKFNFDERFYIRAAIFV